MSDEALVVEAHRRGEELVELCHRADTRDGDEVTASEPSDLTFHAAFLVRAADAGQAEEAVEPVMRPQRDESVRLEPVTTLQHPHDRGLQVVVADPARHTTEVFERADVAVQEHLLRLVQIRAAEPTTRRGEAHHEQRHLHQHASDIDTDRPEIDLGFRAQQMRLRNVDLSQRRRPLGANLRDVTPHRRLTDLSVVLDDESLPHAPGRMALLARHVAIRGEPHVHDRFPRVHHRRRTHRDLPGRRHRRRQGCAHVTTMNLESAR